VLTSPESYGVAAYRAKVTSPVEYVASALRATDAAVTNARSFVGTIARDGRANVPAPAKVGLLLGSPEFQRPDAHRRNTRPAGYKKRHGLSSFIVERHERRRL
jgi:hypothetical protein